MAMSFGNRSCRMKACTIVATSRAMTVKAAIIESPIEINLVNMFVTVIEYLIAAIAAPVMGNEYAHHARENLLNENCVSYHIHIGSTRMY